MIDIPITKDNAIELFKKVWETVKERQEKKDAFKKNLEGFKSDLLDENATIRCYADGTGDGAIESTVDLIYRFAMPEKKADTANEGESNDELPLNFGFQGTIEVYYKPEKTKSKLIDQLGFKQGETSGKLGNATVKLKGAKLDTSAPQEALGFTGGLEAKDVLAKTLNVKTSLRLQPFGGKGEELIEFNDADHKDDPPIVLSKVDAIGGSDFPRRIVHIPDTRYANPGEPSTAPEEIIGLLFGKNAPDVKVMTASGLEKINVQPAFAVALLAGSLLAWQREEGEKKTNEDKKPVVILHLGPLLDADGDKAAGDEEQKGVKALLEKAKGLLQGAKTELETGVNEEDEKAIRAYRARSEYMKKLKVEGDEDDECRFQSLVGPSLKIAQAAIKKLNDDQVLFLQLDTVSDCWRQYAIAQSVLPPVFVETGLTNIAVSAGKPYLRVQKKSEACYPSTTLERINPYSEPNKLRNGAKQLKANLNAWPLKEEKAPCHRLGVSLLREVTKDRETNKYWQYFQEFKKKIVDLPVAMEDKLCVAAAYIQSVLPMPETNPLPKLWDTIQENLDDKQTLDLIPGVFDGNKYKIPDCLASLIENLTGVDVRGKGLKLNDAAAKKKPPEPATLPLREVSADDAPASIEVTGKCNVLEPIGVDANNLNMKLIYTAPHNRLIQETTLAYNQKWAMPEVPWIEFKDVALTVIETAEAAWPTSGALGGTYMPLKAKLETRASRIENKWLVSAEFGEEKDDQMLPIGNGSKGYPSINQAFQMAAGTNLVAVLPAPLDTLADLGLARVEAAYDSEKGVLQSLAFTIRSNNDHSLPLLGQIALGDIEIQTLIMRPKDPDRQIRVEASAQLKIGDAAVVVSVAYPGYVFRGQLAEGEAIEIADLMNSFGLPDCLHPPGEPEITEFDFCYNYETDALAVTMALGINWDFFADANNGKPLFTIKDVGFAITRTLGQNGGNITGSVDIYQKEKDREATSLPLSISAVYSSGSWTFVAKQTDETGLSIEKLINYYIPGCNLPEVLPQINGLEVALGWKNGTGNAAGSASSWKFAAKTAEQYEIPFLDLSIDASFEAGRKESEQSSYAQLVANATWLGIALEVSLQFAEKSAYKLKCPSLAGLEFEVKQEDSTNDKSDWVGSVALKDFTIGGMIETMVSWATGSKFGLAAPWDILDKIKLDGVSLTWNFTQETVSLSVECGEIDLIFATLKGITVTYGSNRGVRVKLLGTGFLKDSPEWDATKPEDTPAPPGAGNQFLDLRLLAMGQHVTVPGLAQSTNVQEAIAKMENMPKPSPGEIPSVTLAPESSWLIGVDFGLLKIKDTSKGVDDGSQE